MCRHSWETSSLLTLFGYGVLWAQMENGRPLSKATPQFLCPKGSNRVSLSSSGGLTCIQRLVCTPGMLALFQHYFGMESCGTGSALGTDRNQKAHSWHLIDEGSHLKKLVGTLQDIHHHTQAWMACRVAWLYSMLVVISAPWSQLFEPKWQQSETMNRNTWLLLLFDFPPHPELIIILHLPLGRN